MANAIPKQTRTNRRRTRSFQGGTGDRKDEVWRVTRQVHARRTGRCTFFLEQQGDYPYPYKWFRRIAYTLWIARIQDPKSPTVGKGGV